MDERLADLERIVSDLSRALDDTRRRVTELETRAGVPRAGAGGADDLRPGVAAESRERDGAILLSLLGRTCVVLGGGYLLRALTDAGTLPRLAGTALGLAYGVAWFAAASRSARASRPASAVFHTVAAVLIAFPLVWEATVRVGLLSPQAAAGALAGISGIGLAVAWQRRAQPLAWIVSAAGIIAALALMAAAAAGAAPPTRSAVAMTLYLAFLGVVTLWFAYRLDWTWLRWPAAIVADICVSALTWSAAGAWQREQAGAVMLVQLVLFAGYVVSFAARTLWRWRAVVPFEVVQTLLLLVVCFGGAVYLMLVTGSNATALGVISVAFGAGSYAAAFAFLNSRHGHWTNFVFYASLGMILTLAGIGLVVRPAVQAAAWSVLAVLGALAGRRFGSITLSSHATVYSVAAAAASGLLAHAAQALVAPATSAWDPLLLPAVPALAAAAVASATPLSSANESWGRWSPLAKVVLVVVLCWNAGGTVCGLLLQLLAVQPGGPAADAAVTSCLRTAILGGSVLLLAWAGRRRFVEGRWLSLVVLVVGGIKLLVEDFPNGRPSTLFLSLAMYGAVLIVGPRLRGPMAGARTLPPPQRV